MSTERLPQRPTATGAAEMFVGHVQVDMLYSGEEPSRARLASVRFAPGAHTAWHCHAVGQTLHVTAGVGYVQSLGGELIELRAGDTVRTPPGEWHWHGASAGHAMTHLTLTEAPDPADDEPEATWGAHLADGEYPG